VSAYIFILVLLALMWFLLIRPQRKRQLQAQQLIDAISVGKEIVTAGGLYGTVTAIEGDEVHIEIAEGVEVRVAKRAVAGVVSEDEPEDEEPEEEPEEDETPEGDKPEEERPATLS
jgi:preprotein translocase subunit YajC